jgi:hypothetical protein
VTGLTGAEALWVFPRVNVLVRSLLSRVAVASGFVRFGARKVNLGFVGLRGFGWSDRRATPV